MTAARTRSARTLARGILRRHGALTPDPLVADLALAIDAAARGALAVGDGPERVSVNRAALDIVADDVGAIAGDLRHHARHCTATRDRDATPGILNNLADRLEHDAGCLDTGDATPAADWRKLALDLGNAIEAVEGAMRAADEAWNPLIAFGHVRIELWQALGDAITSAALLARRCEVRES